MEIVEVGCPRSIDLISLPGLKDKYKDAKSILETIDIYDYISIKRDIKNSTGILITSYNDIDEILKDDIRKIITLFSNYVGIKINDIIIDIKYDENILFKSNESLLAGLLLSLDIFYKTQLTMHELIFLAEKLNPLISYYVLGGYKKINDNDNSYNIGDNPYNKYILIDKKIENKQEEERLRNFLSSNHLTYGLDNIYFIAMKNVINTSIPISLKREFSNTIVHAVNNARGHKILLKYLK